MQLRVGIFLWVCKDQRSVCVRRGERDTTEMCTGGGRNEFILMHHRIVSLWLLSNRINAALRNNEADYISDLKNVHGIKSKWQNNMFPIIPFV